MCKSLNESIYPHVFRFAIVRGSVDVAVNSKNAGKMDGPAFHTASDLIERAKKDDRYYWFHFGSRFAEFDPLLIELTNLSHILRDRWSSHQRRVIELYGRLGSQRQVADKLGVTQQAVSYALRQAHWRELRRTEDLVTRVLTMYDSHNLESLCSQKQVDMLVTMPKGRRR